MPLKDLEARRTYNRSHYAEHLEQRRAAQRKWHLAHPGHNKAWKLANPEKAKAIARASYLRNYEKNREKRRIEMKAYHAARRAADPERIRAMSRRNKIASYGITEADYDALSAAQSHGCAVCHAPLPLNRSGHIDHDHNTGVVRGLLCMRCNVGIGNLRDDPELLASAIEYLQKAQHPQLRLVQTEVSK